MRIRWDADETRDAVIEAARRSSSVPVLVDSLRASLGDSITADAVRSAWRRYQGQRIGLRSLPETLGTDGAVTDDAEPRLVVPREARAPEIPDDRSASDSGKLPRSILSDGDCHYPIVDKGVEAAKIAFARDVKPDVWVNIGDHYDCWLISSHDKEPARMFDPGARLQEEFDSSREYWQAVATLSRRAHLILGNHENRLQRLLAANLGLFGLRALEWHGLAELPPMVQVHEYGTRLRVGALTFEHGDKIGGKMGCKHPAAWLLDNRGNRNTVFGHTHRMETKHRTIWDEEGKPHSYVAINQGHGSDVSKQRYVTDPSWTHGFTYVECYAEGGKPRFTAHVIPVVNGRFWFGGREYGRPWQ